MPRDIPLGRSGVAPQSATAFEATTKACVAELFAEHGGHKVAIDRFGVSLRRAYTFTEIGSGERIAFERVAMLTSAKATAAARYLATLAGGVFVPLPAPKASPPLMLTGDCIRSHAAALGEAIDALADHKVTAVEAAAVLKKIDAAAHDLMSLRASVTAMSEADKK